MKNEGEREKKRVVLCCGRKRKSGRNKCRVRKSVEGTYVNVNVCRGESSNW